MELPDRPNLRHPRDQAKELEQAIAANDLARVQALLTSIPELRQVLIDDVPLMTVAHPGRVPMMELLVRHGADVNGLRWGWFPVLFTPCENLEPEPLQWLLDHGADPNRGNPNDPGTALDYVIQTYPREPRSRPTPHRPRGRPHHPRPRPRPLRTSRRAPRRVRPRVRRDLPATLGRDTSMSRRGCPVSAN